tara:strand:- start:22 stop:213 length:192 start_codon:yes stop_codon:yes gene_type:complete
MILSKMLVNQIATYLTKHFKLDKIMSYVFDKNELDTKVEELERRISIMENFKCNYKPKEEDNG